MNKLREWTLGSISAEAMLDYFGDGIDEKTRTQLKTIIKETRSDYQHFQCVKNIGATNERNSITMDEIKSEYVNVKREYLKTIECGAELAEYRKGYIQGLSEGIGYAERLIRAMQGKE